MSVPWYTIPLPTTLYQVLHTSLFTLAYINPHNETMKWVEKNKTIGVLLLLIGLCLIYILVSTAVWRQELDTFTENCKKLAGVVKQEKERFICVNRHTDEPL